MFRGKRSYDLERGEACSFYRKSEMVADTDIEMQAEDAGRTVVGLRGAILFGQRTGDIADVGSDADVLGHVVLRTYEEVVSYTGR